VNDDDVTVLGAAYAPGSSNGVWALGDFEYNGFIDDDDVTLLGVFYNPAAGPLSAPVAGAVNGESSSGDWSIAQPQQVRLAEGPEDRQGLAPAVRPGFVVALDRSRSEGPTQNRAKNSELPSYVDLDEEVLVDLLATAVVSSIEDLSDPRLATSLGPRESSDDIWALEWI
jgi:hypothetical protein